MQLRFYNASTHTIDTTIFRRYHIERKNVTLIFVWIFTKRNISIFVFCAFSHIIYQTTMSKNSKTCEIILIPFLRNLQCIKRSTTNLLNV
jgi:hypothetical protein